MITHFQPIYPVSPLLTDHIYCYYTVQSDRADFRSAHYSFPHTYNAVSLYRGAAFSNMNGQLKIVGDGSDTLTCVLQGKRQHPVTGGPCPALFRA
jgi:hypothetical protein